MHTENIFGASLLKQHMCCRLNHHVFWLNHHVPTGRLSPGIPWVPRAAKKPPSTAEALKVQVRRLEGRWGEPIFRHSHIHYI
jgi:hypothetical protein